MCILCTSFKNNELTILEAWSNYSEMVETMKPQHAEEVFAMLVLATENVDFSSKMPQPSLEKIKGKENG